MSKTNILIVGGDEALCYLLCQYLDKQGFAVDSVENGMAMDLYLKKSIPDLIILDQMMLGEDGYKFLLIDEIEWNCGNGSIHYSLKPVNANALFIVMAISFVWFFILSPLSNRVADDLVRSTMGGLAVHFERLNLINR